MQLYYFYCSDCDFSSGSFYGHLSSRFKPAEGVAQSELSFMFCHECQNVKPTWSGLAVTVPPAELIRTSNILVRLLVEDFTPARMVDENVRAETNRKANFLVSSKLSLQAVIYRIFELRAMQLSTKLKVAFGSPKPPRCLECGSDNILNERLLHTCGSTLEVKYSKTIKSQRFGKSSPALYDSDGRIVQEARMVYNFI